MMNNVNEEEEAISGKELTQIEDTEEEGLVEADIESSLPSLFEVEEILGYKFRNKNLLEEAFTHASFSPSDHYPCYNYERLEFVGDAVLNLLFTKEQYFLYPALSPGSLTRLRASNVDSEKLARVAIKHGFHRYLRHKKPNLKEKIEEFTREIRDFPLHSNGLISVPKDLADVVESVIGAIFIDADSSLDTVWKVFKELLEPIISPETMTMHPVTELYEACQKRNLKLKFVDSWEKSMSFDVFVDDELVGRGACSLKKEIAHNRAAKDALNNISGRLLVLDLLDQLCPSLDL